MKDKMTKVGRPPIIGEANKAKFRQQAFYFPLRFDYVWKEFNRICQSRIILGKMPSMKNRCKSIVIRRLIFDYLLKHSTSVEIKRDVIKFMEDEKEAMEKSLRNYRQKK